MLLSASRSSATLALHISEVLLFLFGVVLILGLLGEYQESEYWKKRLKIFELMVIIGVVGELWADGAIFMFSEQVQAIDEARVAKLDQEVISAETEAKDAYTSAGKAVSKAGEADERASANDLRAANLERENLEIRKQMVERGPRWVLLYGEQRKRLLGRVKPFAG
ncbi:MAG: hypothetical protein ACJ74Z_00085, partial [Bryobacteraceae bacterium]